MKSLIFGLGALSLLGASTQALAWPFGGVSGTLIPAGETFLLGGGQDGAFKINACNTGTVAVDISSQTRESTRFIASLRPDDCIDHAFAVGEMATLRNSSNSIQASLKIKINRDLNGLGMRYRPSENP